MQFWKDKKFIIAAVIVLSLLLGLFLYNRNNKKKKGVQIPDASQPEQKTEQKTVQPAAEKYRLSMRKLWGESAHWWKEYITIATSKDESPAINAVSQRLIKNQEDISALVGKAYGQEKGKAVSEAFKTYAIQGGEVLAAIAASDKERGIEADKKWKKSAEDLADAFLQANSNLRGDLLKENLKRQTEAMLGLIKAKADAGATITAFDGLYNQSMGLADLLS